MHGEPALPSDFAHLPYANPGAPKGGRLVFAETGGFDSLNPFILKGRAPWALRSLTVESLLARSWDEPFTLYASLAESVETPPDRSWVRFTLDPRARFSDGAQVTVDDVIWSFETLGREGHPRYRNAWKSVDNIRQTGPRSLQIDFSEPNRELPMIMGLRPVLQRAQFENQAFDASGLAPVTGSGPYAVAEFEPSRHLTLKLREDWWGRDLPVNRGLYNFAEIRFDYYLNGDALWSAVKTGGVSLFPDADPVRWAEGYGFPLAAEGGLVQAEIPHRRPTGMEGFVFNTRRPVLADRRVREAMALAFDWEWANQRLFRGQFRRIQSYYDNSELGFQGAAEGREADFLAPYAEALPESTIAHGWRPPQSDGSGRDRRNLRKAGRLLEAAGWKASGNARIGSEGQPLRIEILVQSTDHETLAALWAKALARIGVEAVPRRVDATEYEARRREYDYDITVNRWWLSLSPGTEQWLYFGSAGRTDPGTRNYMGVASPAVDGMIEALLAAEDRPDFAAAVRALDRALSSGIYVVPLGTLPTDRVAHLKALERPDTTPLYGFRFERWWHAPAPE